MKRIFLLFALAFFGARLFSQSCEGPPLLNETFDNGIPGTWTILNLDAGVVSAVAQLKGYTGLFQSFNHYGEKCVANTSAFTPPVNADDWLITPAITLGAAPVCLSWKACSSLFGGEQYEVHISTTTPTVAGMNANAALFTQPSENIRWTEYSVDLSAYAGQTVYIGFWYSSSNTRGFYLDNIRVSQPVSRDLRVTSVALNDVVAAGSYSITGTLLNGGLAAINSMDLNWKVNSGLVHTSSISSLNITPSSYYNYTHGINWNPSSNGVYTLKIWASNLNGMTDQYNSNDTLTRTIFVHSNPRKVLFEEFTNTSCGPCAAQNPHLDSLLSINLLAGKASAIKYHGWWPGMSDPMYVFNTAENRNRVQYYGVIGVPTVQVDGLIIPDHCGYYDGAPMCLNQNDIDSARSIPSVFKIQVSNAVSGNNFNGSVTVTALTDVSFPSLVLRTVVIEDTIIYSTPPGNNGETNFYQVLRKMLPDTDGKALPSLLQNQTFTYNFSWPISNPCVASQLHTVAFIQDENTGKVWQSEITTPYVTEVNEVGKDEVLKVSPNPSSGEFQIQISNGQYATSKEYKLEIYNVYGEKIYSAPAIKGEKQIDLSNQPNGIYFLQLKTAEGIANEKIIISK